MTVVIRAQPADAWLVVLGDLNTDQDSPRGRQEDALAAEATEHGIVCATKHFLSKQTRHVRGQWMIRRPSYTPEGGNCGSGANPITCKGARLAARTELLVGDFPAQQ